MTGSTSFLRNFKTTTPGQFVTFGINMQGEVRGHGDITNGKFTVKKVGLVDGRKHNLISFAQLRIDSNNNIK